MSVFSMNIERLNMYYFVNELNYPHWTMMREVNTAISLSVG